MIVRGKTGSYINKLRARALLRASAWNALAIAAGFVVVINLQKILDASFSPLLLIAILAVGALSASAGRAQWVKYNKATAGLNSERKVVSAIKKTNAAALVNGAVLNDHTGDADHVVLGPCCALVETKTGRGEVQYKNGSLYAGGRQIPKDPIKQANRQALELRRKAGVYATAIVCVVNMTNRPFKVNSTWVCSAADLANVLDSCPRVLTREQAERIANSLA